MKKDLRASSPLSHLPVNVLPRGAARLHFNAEIGSIIMQHPYVILLCHRYRVINHGVIQVALLVEGNPVWLRVALFVRRTNADGIFP